MSAEKYVGSRGPQINIKLNSEEKKLFEVVAKKHGLNVSGLVRMLILAEARRLGIS